MVSGSTQRLPDSDRASLALPGVYDEVQTLTKTLKGHELLNAQFTEATFRDEASSGRYNVVHIASHGFFGGSANDSFILTYDELLTLSDLQALLESEAYRAAPIEILSLSACETAEGNARSPLGISGAAMKARAKSVLGTLWPVDDEAARSVMEQFYSSLESRHVAKVDALREAQLQLLHDPKTADPFYWAPFVLIGNWL
jgi:CHAT domain-containing protein